MSTETLTATKETEQPPEQKDNIKLPTVRLLPAKTTLDWATLLGLLFAFGLIGAAIMISQSNASFFNVPSLMIVLFGTLAVTAVSFTTEEITKFGHVFAKSFQRKTIDYNNMATTLVDLAVIAKKKGILALSNYNNDLERHPFLARAIQMIVDGYGAEEVDQLLHQEIDTLTERHKRSASIARRAAEIAPAMGLIGTLVGLVQMLADLENPETIGPAMAVALLTTFYGAILGTIVMAPLAVKLDKNSNDEALAKTLARIAASSIARQDNPRRLEMLLNSELPPADRIQYFD